MSENPSSVVTPAAPYGIKAIRQIKGNRKPSERLTRKIHDTHNYFLEKVDPIIGACITHLLCEQPSDVVHEMHNFLTLYHKSKILENGSSLPTHNIDDKKPRKELKLYLATNIGPLISKLVNRVATSKPDDVIGFLTKELQNIIEENGNVSTKKDDVTLMKSICIMLIGNVSSGKSSFLQSIEGRLENKPRPTLGFRPVSLMLGEEMEVRFFDLGGNKTIRKIWDSYYHDSHAIIYMVDSTEDDVSSSIELFHSAMANELVIGKPIFFVANKQDKPHARSLKELREMYEVDKYDNVKCFLECCSEIPDDYNENFKIDEKIEKELENFLKEINKDFDKLNERVIVDMKKKELYEAKLRFEREKNVLRNKIAIAFAQQVDVTKYTGKIDHDPASIYSEEEGINYLAGEIGEDPVGLPQMAKDCAALVGYQRLALSMIGGFKCPINKKKASMEWSEIYNLLVEIRGELGIPNF